MIGVTSESFINSRNQPLREHSVTNKANHKRLLDSLNTAICLLDTNQQLRYLNIAAEHLLDISSQKALGLSLKELFINPDDDLLEIEGVLSGRGNFTKRAAELTLLNGKVITVDYSVNIVGDNSDDQLLLELRSLEHSHRINREESITAAHATTRELVRGLAHEIKNPLGGIRGAAQLLAEELANPELLDYTNIVIEEADRLRNLVDRLVGLRSIPDLKPTNIHEILERVHSLVEAEFSDNTIKLVRDYDPSIPDLPADPEQLIQASLNIVRNAMQALSNSENIADGNEIILQTRVIRNATLDGKFHRLAAVIKFFDNGPGIPRDIQHSLFFPMVSRRADGTGLGLSIAHDIVTRHKGQIECDSVKGETIFSMLLPIK
jgi:two-component system nitrogen regulation sensor histidine kinase GlnL